MTDKAYIVANEQQEREVLDKLEREGMMWGIINEKPTDNKPSNWFKITIFPYVIFVDDVISWNFISRLEDEEIVYDGRKEEQMSDKYVVSHEFMNELEQWKQSYFNDDLMFVDGDTLDYLPIVVNAWWGGEVSDEENNNRLIAIIRWVNGEDVFEVESNKWVVRSKECDEGGNYQYIKVGNFNMSFNRYEFENATKFDTKEEAESWANSHQEVVEVEA